MIKLGITGGIGSGKSTVTNIFKILQVPVYIADIESKRLTESSPIIRSKLIELFGDKIYDGDKLNKQLLASHIFNDKEKLDAVNSIIHPEVNKDFCKWVETNKNSPIVVLETAILFESGMDKYTDKVITVYTPFEDRISRTMQRDNLSREKVIERINNQLPDEEKMERSDFVIHNDGSRSLIEQCLNIMYQYDNRGRYIQQHI